MPESVSAHPPTAPSSPAISPPLGPARSTPSRHPLAPLFNTDTVRLRCAAVLLSVEQNLSASFRLDRSALDLLARRVTAHLQAQVGAASTFKAPFWQQLQSGGVDRLAELSQLLSSEPAAEQARAWADLALLGGLLGADPGPRWRYTEQQALPPAAFAQATPDELLALLDRAGKTPVVANVPLEDSVTASSTPSSTTASTTPPTTSGGSTGLALATFRAFVAGAFSADKAHPCRADAATLRHVDVAALRAMLQGTPQNAIHGLEGRAAVLSRLGQLLPARLSDLVLPLRTPAEAGSEAGLGASLEVTASALFKSLLTALTPAWPSAPVQGLPAGDVWSHRWAGEAVGADLGANLATDLGTDLGTSGWVPLHAAAQALVGALALPLQHAGYGLTGLQTLTASADCNTSALLLAAGVIVPRQQRLLSQTLKLGDEAVIECRALTVTLFDELTEKVSSLLQPASGTNAAGLQVAEVVHATAAVLAGGGAPSLRIAGDGALF